MNTLQGRQIIDYADLKLIARSDIRQTKIQKQQFPVAVSLHVVLFFNQNISLALLSFYLVYFSLRTFGKVFCFQVKTPKFRRPYLNRVLIVERIVPKSIAKLL